MDRQRHEIYALYAFYAFLILTLEKSMPFMSFKFYP